MFNVKLLFDISKHVDKYHQNIFQRVAIISYLCKLKKNNLYYNKINTTTMKKEFPKAYEPILSEDKWYPLWLENKIFAADNNSNKEAYSILMPPPNVTGILHFGHVLNSTLQDIYIRWKRMQGYEVCWFPGMDHAGIATQARVEKELKATENLSRYDLGREKFVEKVWEWKEKYGGIIFNQLQKLGISTDWDRTLFTMDESASNAVKEVFIRLFDEGLVYKGKRIINWSPLAQTALSDEEVEFKEINEKLYTLRYYFEDSNDYLMVATVRTETIFGDIAVAVNPNDERYKHLIGKNVIVPLVGRKVPVIPDEHADPEFGTGCVKITPAHDPNDFLVGERHNLDIINTINPDATLNENAGEFAGLDRFEARKRVSKKLEELNLIEKVEDYAHNVGISQRGGEPVEPLLSDQWFVKMKPLAELALKVVQDGEIKFHPNHWIKTYEHWMNNIKDWCISRQLWWGHQIPVYYTEDGRFTAAIDEAHAREKLGLDANVALKQEEDVLDTWFSSWLWPMTTMGWMNDHKTESTPDLEKFLPTDLLVTGPDIIFFWVARMIMATEKFKGEIPFKDVYFTSMIRDGQGRKLSKSLGNSPDPLNIIAKYGADAVRFTMIFLAPLGQDVRMDVDVDAQDIPSMEIGRNFANKVWNAGRFLNMKLDQAIENNNGNSDVYIDENTLTTADKWIRSRYNTTIEKLNQSLSDFKVTEYSKMLYDFIWRDFCDWYVEIVKIQFNDADSAKQVAIAKFAIEIYEGILRMLHPVMPFITEELWHLLSGKDDNETISTQATPMPNNTHIDSNIEDKLALVQNIVEEIRKLRSSTSIPPSQKLPVAIAIKENAIREVFSEAKNVIAGMAKCSELEIAESVEKPSSSLSSVVREIEIFVSLGDAIDLDKERERLEKEIARLEGNIRACEKKLSNEKFVSNAPADVVAYEKEKLDSMKESLLKVKDNLANL